MKLYRFEDHGNGDCVTLMCYDFAVVKETELSYQILLPYSNTKRWVRKNGKKKYAHATKEDAMISFKKRKARQIAILKSQLNTAKAAIKLESENVPVYFGLFLNYDE